LEELEMLPAICNVFLSLPQMKNWKRRYFLLEENAVSYFKSDLVSGNVSLSSPPSVGGCEQGDTHSTQNYLEPPMPTHNSKELPDPVG
jgi:hypothetical protein